MFELHKKNAIIPFKYSKYCWQFCHGTKKNILIKMGKAKGRSKIAKAKLFIHCDLIGIKNERRGRAEKLQQFSKAMKIG